VCYQKSFFPDCIPIWNSFSNEIVNSPTYAIFTNHVRNYLQLNKETLMVEFTKAYHNYTSKLLTQFRLGLSPLKYDLFAFNIIENPFCPSCGDHVETVRHFFLVCPKYAVCRADLLCEINSIAVLIVVHAPFLIDITGNPDTLLECLIGRAVLPPGDIWVNRQYAIFRCVSQFIAASDRFKN